MAIVGGGWSGFAAAVTLVDAGLSVVVLESSDTLGGRARRVALDEMTVDNGQHLMLGAYATTLALIDRVHRDRDAGEPPLTWRMPLHLAGPGRFELRARVLPAPLHMVAALAFMRDSTLSERLAMVRSFTRWKREQWTTDPRTTVAQLLAGQPQPLIERIWSPLCLAALNTPIESASAQVFLNVLSASLASSRKASDLVIPMVDLSSLFPDAAARTIEAAGSRVFGATRVRSIVLDDVPAAIDAGGVAHRAKSIIVATAPWQAVPLLDAHPEAADAVGRIHGYRYEPICTVYLRFESPMRLPVPMMQLGHGPGQWVFVADSAELDPIVAVVISADGPYRALSRAALVERVCTQLERNFPRWAPQAPVASQVIIERRATHASVPGRSHPLAGAIGRRGLFLAGDHTDPAYPATLEAACRSGVAAAEAVIRRIREPRLGKR